MTHRKRNEWRVWALAGFAAALALAVGLSNLGEPSLWHDEAVHVFVAKNIVETGVPQHNTGVPYYSGTTWNYLLAFVIRFWGWSEAAVRTPAVVIAALNVLLTFAVIRPLLGIRVALVTAFAMALNPWTVAWSREARFYGLQQGFYLCTVGAFWQATVAPTLNRAFAWGAVASAAYLLGILTAFHSGLFLSGLGVYAAGLFLLARSERKRWFWTGALVGVAAVATFGMYAGLLNPYDRYMIYGQGGVGGEFVDEARTDRLYYFTWLRFNLSTGFILLAMAGFLLMVARERRRGWFVALAFWMPLLLLTFLIGYRRPRFMFFAFPFYVAAVSYASVLLANWLVSPKPRIWQRIAAIAVAVFCVRLLMSALFLIGDSLVVASGADTTLAKHHPRWQEPCAYVRTHVQPDEVVLTTTWLPTLYYVGRVDNWYPTRALWGEVDEAGVDNLKGLDELKQFVAEHPKGYFLSDWWRFERNAGMQEERQWVLEHMSPLWEHSSADITLYSWGIDRTEAE